MYPKNTNPNIIPTFDVAKAKALPKDIVFIFFVPCFPVTIGGGRAKLGIFEGDLFEGELEIGQGASMIKHLQPVSEVMQELVEDYNTALRRIQDELNWN